MDINSFKLLSFVVDNECHESFKHIVILSGFDGGENWFNKANLKSQMSRK